MFDLIGMLWRRIAYGALAIFLLMTTVFFLLRFVGDPALQVAGSDATAEQLAAVRAKLGLNHPVWKQYLHMLRDTVSGNFGRSFRTNQSAVDLVFARLPATMQLMVIALALAIVIGIPIGVLSASRPGSLLDGVTRVGSVIGQSMPGFWLGILMILLFAVELKWFPSGGRGTWKNLVLPGVTLSAYSIPITTRVTRSAMLDVLSKDYIRTARSKGMSEWKVVFKHALRSSMIPVITVLALRLGFLITGAIVLEEVFAYPGVGRLAINAMNQRDFPVVQAFVVIVAALVVFINLIADVLYTVVDPRVRVG